MNIHVQNKTHFCFSRGLFSARLLLAVHRHSSRQRQFGKYFADVDQLDKYDAVANATRFQLAPRLDNIFLCLVSAGLHLLVRTALKAFRPTYVRYELFYRQILKCYTLGTHRHARHSLVSISSRIPAAMRHCNNPGGIFRPRGFFASDGGL